MDSPVLAARKSPAQSPVPARLAIAHKFGGSSLADADAFRRVADNLRARGDARQIVVASAMQGVTDALLALVDSAVRRSPSWPRDLRELRDRHCVTANDLLGLGAPATLDWLRQRFAELDDTLTALAMLGSHSEDARDAVQGMGEIFSSRMLANYLRSLGERVDWLDAREVLVVAKQELGVAVDWDASAGRLDQWRMRHDAPWTIVAGFVARTASGRPTTLGRNGSDYSGAIFSVLFDAAELHIWTDVDGVLSADPRRVPEAVPLAALSYHEACELAYFGAKVIHPQTMAPAMARGLPILIRNTFRPEFPGTRIDDHGDRAGPVKGLTLASGLALLNLEGAGMIGVPGTAQRLFDALRMAGVSVVMISQGSSEHSICCVLRAVDAERAQRAASEAFANELARGQVQAVAVTPDISVLAAVGDGMAGTPGVAARLFEALARARVNVRAIAQGASERNISVAVASHDADRALRAAHAGFWLSPQTISVGVIGPGKVGQALLEQLRDAMPRLRREANLDLRVRALADRRRMWLDELGQPCDWREALRGSDCACDLVAFGEHVLTEHLPHAIIVDCSASDAVAAHYADWLAAGIHVITPNKQAGAGPLPRYRAIRAASNASGARFRYEATVGAGLPVIQTLRDLLDTGDQLRAVEGIFSGTLAWLFNRYDGLTPFSALVREAQALGYTEPDPRDDLSGTDVARKLVILAREAGLALSLDQVEVESLAFETDESMQRRFAQATSGGNVLRYVARLGFDGIDARARVGLVELPAGHAFAHLRLTDNVVQFSTRRYADSPLVVQGPGAGPDVTAAGVFADLLRVASSLGSKL